MKLNKKRIYRFIFIFFSITTITFPSESIEKSNLNNISKQVNLQLHKNNLNAVSIIAEESDSSFKTIEFSSFLENELSSKLLAMNEKIKIVERRNLEKILNEQKLQLSGLTNSETSIKIGELTNVQSILIINYSVLKGKLLVKLKLINAETGDLCYSSNSIIPLKSKLKKIINKGKFYFYATGYGQSPNDTSMSIEIKNRMAERAAQADAYRNLIEKIKGTYVNFYTNVENIKIVKDKISTQSSGYLKNVKIVDKKISDDGIAEVRVLLKISKKEMDLFL